MRDLNVAVIQDVIDWQDPEPNRKRYDRHMSYLGNADLIVLPEMFSTGFSMEPWLCPETMQGDTVAWMLDRASQTGAVITGSVIMKPGDRYLNRMIWARPDGAMKFYDKRHLFRFGNEHINYQSGDKRVVLELNGWRVALFICYDLRFPVWCRNRGDYDVALFVANWPDARQTAWDTLIRARAIENQAYVLGVNRIGVDGIGNTFSGGSVILDFLGQPLVDFSDREMAICQPLSMEKLQEFRQHFPAALDADDFRIVP